MPTRHFGRRILTTRQQHIPFGGFVSSRTHDAGCDARESTEMILSAHVIVGDAVASLITDHPALALPAVWLALSLSGHRRHVDRLLQAL
jgi:hypothetical protein